MARAQDCYCFRFLSTTLGGGWVTLTGSEPGKLSSRPCSSDLSSLRFARFLALAPGLLVDLVFVNAFRSEFPCKLSLQAIAVRRHPGQRPGQDRRSAGFPFPDAAQYNKTMRIMTCIEDLRQRARRKVPKMFFDYAEAGSYAQETLRANRADLEHIKLRQRVLVDVSQRDLATTILGETVPLPLALGADRARRHDAWRRRDPGLPRGAGGRHPVHALDHVDQLDRGRGAARSTSRSGSSSTSCATAASSAR